MNVAQLESVTYQPVETGVHCGGEGHRSDCVCDVNATSLLAAPTVPLWEIPFAEPIAKVTGWPETRREMADFLCASLGLWEEQKRLERDDPRLVAALDSMAELSRDRAYEVERTYSYDAASLAARAAVYLAERISLEEVATLLDVTPSEIAKAFTTRSTTPSSTTSLTKLSDADLCEMDMDCRLGVLNRTQIAQKFDVSLRVVETWTKRANLTHFRKFRGGSHNDNRDGNGKFATT